MIAGWRGATPPKVGVGGMCPPTGRSLADEMQIQGKENILRGDLRG